MSSIIYNRLRLEAQRTAVTGVSLGTSKSWGFSKYALSRVFSLPLCKTRASSSHSCIAASQSQHQRLNKPRESIVCLLPRSAVAAGDASSIHSRVSSLGQVSSKNGVLTTQRLRFMSTTSSSPVGDLNPILPGNIFRSPKPDLELPTDVSIHQRIFEACDQYKDNLAVEEFLTGRRYTYSQLKEAVVRVSSALYRMGYRKGDILLAFAPNSADYAVLIVACAAAGVWFTAANPTFTAGELARQLNHCNPKGIITVPALTAVAKDAVASNEFPSNVEDFMVFGEASGFEPFQNLLDDDGKAFPDVDVDPMKDVFVLPYSSGTTGFPKGVMLSHHNCVANCIQFASFFSKHSNDRCLGLLPLFHIFGQVINLFPTLIAGASVSYLPKFEPESFLACLQERKITTAYLVPPLVLFLTKHPMVSNYDLTSVKNVLVGAAPLGQSLMKEYLERHPNVEHCVQGFGLTETGPALTMDPSNTLGCVGPLLPNTLGKIVDLETNKPLGVGEQGEICAKGPQIMLGYYKNQKATEDMITPDGWLHTGDIGYFDEKCQLFVVDRLKELIKYKGSQVAPAELEAVLLSHPDIQDAAVIGVPDEAAGELPKAFVVARPGTELTEDQVASFVEDKVTPWKRLQGGVQFVDEVPKSPSGKILRRILRNENI